MLSLEVYEQSILEKFCERITTKKTDSWLLRHCGQKKNFKCLYDSPKFVLILQGALKHLILIPLSQLYLLEIPKLQF